MVLASWVVRSGVRVEACGMPCRWEAVGDESLQGNSAFVTVAKKTGLVAEWVSVGGDR